MENTVALVTKVPPGATEAPRLWQIRGPIAPAEVSLLYKLGMAAVALAMVLLPLLYLGLIAAVAYATYGHAIDGLALFEKTRSAKGALLLYVGPLLIGALVVVFMIKPIFARRPKHVEPKAIDRDEEPGLFAFIDHICDLVRAPRPSRVQLDLQVNASASFRRGFLSLLGQDLTLTIGLPLVAGLNARQFGGVLAHEFGHFAQGAGMRLTFIVRSVNAWFSRVVYERDAWDEGLATAARELDVRIGIIFHAARLMIWLTRKLLWVFMVTGHGISCFMLRQMEFDADHYETQVAGSRGFAETAGQLRRLGVAWQRSIAQQQEAFQGKRLVDNLPGFVALETQRLSPEINEALDKAAQEGKTGWFDTHPSDADRTGAAECAASDGVLVGEASATELFADFAATAQRLTEGYYREECELELQGVKFLPLAEMAAEAAADAEGRRAMDEYFGELLSIRTLFFLSPGDLKEAPSDLPAQIGAARARHQALLARVPPVMKDLLDADQAEVLAVQARALLSAGFKIKKEEFHLAAAKPEAVGTVLEALRPELQRRRTSLDEVIAATRERLVVALQLFGPPYAPDASATAQEIGALLATLGRFDETEAVIIALRNDQNSLEILLQNASNADGDIAWSATARPIAERLQTNVAHLLRKAHGVNYPFSHGSGTIALADYLGECNSHDDAIVQAYLQGQALLDRFFSLYRRLLSRLAVLAQQAETQALAARPADLAA